MFWVFRDNLCRKVVRLQPGLHSGVVGQTKQEPAVCSVGSNRVGETGDLVSIPFAYCDSFYAMRSQRPLTEHSDS